MPPLGRPVALLVLVGCATPATPEPAGRAAGAPGLGATAAADPVARGRFLVGIGSCGDCHTPMKLDAAIGLPVQDASRTLSGHPEGAPDPQATPGPQDQAVIGPTFTSFRTSLGTVYTANLTPDRETGLGAWTPEQFVRALRTGRHQGAADGRPIVPPMPWLSLRPLGDDDLRAIFAYLQTLPPIHNRVPAPSVPADGLQSLGASYDRLLATLPPSP